jgi:hypothetical protein
MALFTELALEEVMDLPSGRPRREDDDDDDGDDDDDVTFTKFNHLQYTYNF